MKKQHVITSVKIMEWLICITVFFLPLIYFPSFTFAYTSSKFVFFGFMALLIGGLATWTFFRYPALGRNLIRNKLFLFGICFYFLAYFVAVLHSVNRSFSFWGSFERGTGGLTTILLVLFVLGVYTVARLKGKDFMKHVLLASFLGAIILSISVILSPDGLNVLRGPIIAQAGGGGYIGNSSLAAAYVLFNVFFGLILFTKYISKKVKVFIGISLALLVLSPLFINFHYFQNPSGIFSLIGSARGATGGLLFGLLSAFGLYLLYNDKKSVKSAGITLCVLLASGLIFITIRLLDPTSQIHAVFIKLAKDTRFEYWQIAVQAFHAHPLLGWGPENFDIPFHAYFNPHSILSEGRLELVLDRPHNVLLEQLAGGGLLLLLGYLSYIGTIIFGLVQATTKKFLTRAEGVLLLGALIGWFIQNQLVFDSLASLTLIFLLTGLSLAFYTTSDDKERILKQMSKTKEYIAGAGIVLVVVTSIIYFSILPAVKSAALKNIYNLPTAERAMEWGRLGSISPIGNDSDTGVFGQELYDYYISELPVLRNASPEDKENAIKDIEGGISHFKSLTDIGGAGYDNYRLTLLVSKFYLLKFLISGSLTPEEFSDAQTYIQHSLALSPTDPEAYWLLAQIDFVDKEVDEAKVALASAQNLEPDIPTTYQYMLNIATVTKDETYFEQSLAQAQAHIPGFTFNAQQ